MNTGSSLPSNEAQRPCSSDDIEFAPETNSTQAEQGSSRSGGSSLRPERVSFPPSERVRRSGRSQAFRVHPFETRRSPTRRRAPKDRKAGAAVGSTDDRGDGVNPQYERTKARAEDDRHESTSFPETTGPRRSRRSEVVAEDDSSATRGTEDAIKCRGRAAAKTKSASGDTPIGADDHDTLSGAMPPRFTNKAGQDRYVFRIRTGCSLY